MTIWVIGRNYPLPENNMQGSFELEQAKMLSRFGNDVRYLACSLHPVRGIKNRGIRSWTDEGVKVTLLSEFFAPRIYPFYFVRARNRKWEKLFEEAEKNGGVPDVIHLHYPSMLMIADSLRHCRDKGVRIVATEHWTKVLAGKLDRAEVNEFRKYAGVTDHMICVGSPLKNAVREQTGIESIVVPNIANELFRPSEEKHDGFRFAAVGRLVRVKQFDRIIEAFAECFSGEKDITLTIIGGGEQKEELQNIIDERDLNAQVKLSGSLDRKATAETLAGSDCLVCYSRLETFGVPIIEAWACGLPVIASTAAAVTDGIDERLGIEVSYDDPDGLKQAMRYICDHRNEYDRSFISDFAKTHFSEKAVYDMLLDLYKERHL